MNAARGFRSILALPRRIAIAPLLAWAALLTGTSGCGTPVVKPSAMDAASVGSHPVAVRHIETEGEERIVAVGSHWLGIERAADRPVFAAYRFADGTTRFVRVMASDPEHDRLVMAPLAPGETPLSVLSAMRGPEGADGRGASSERILERSLRNAVDEGRLGIPIPLPRQVFAVAANFPSHLRQDLALKEEGAVRSLAGARPRVFRKYPPAPPPGAAALPDGKWPGLVGPFDTLRFPDRIRVPGDTPGTAEDAATVVDYEAEIGAVIGRRLDWDLVKSQPDIELRKAVAGYVLVSDAKARNPQAVGRIRQIDRPMPEGPDPYRTGDDDLDRALGPWNAEVCQWWSYAAGWGNYGAIGPFFAAAPPDGSLPSRLLIGARSYGTGTAPRPGAPAGRLSDVFYLRQASVVSDGRDHPDAMVWEIPAIIRSILAPDSVLRFDGSPVVLHPGDVIALGTPGGTVITSRPLWLLETAEDLLFWREAMDWHDAFFGPDRGLYLLPGDEVFIWADGLGYQRLRVGAPEVAK